MTLDSRKEMARLAQDATKYKAKAAKYKDEIKKLEGQNRLLLKLLEINSIPLPKEAKDYAKVNELGEEAYIYRELDAIRLAIEISKNLLLEALYSE